MSKKIGLIAGEGKLPFVVTEGAHAQDYEVFVCAIQGGCDTSIETVCDATQWVKVGELGKVINFFRKQGVENVLLAGKVPKANLFSGNVRPDIEMAKALLKIKDWRDDSLLLAVVDHLEKNNLTILDSTTFLQQNLLLPGLLTRSKPSKAENEDIEFGWKMARAIGGLDIGQTVVVKNKAVLAAEAIEGTDEAIRRGGHLGRGGSVAVKVAKPDQDMRFDVPCIGLKTLQVMAEARVRVLAMEAHKAILIERDEVIDFANKNKICVVVKE